MKPWDVGEAVPSQRGATSFCSTPADSNRSVRSRSRDRGRCGRNKLHFIDQGRTHWIELDTDEPIRRPTISSEAEVFIAIIRSHYYRKVGLSMTQTAIELRRAEAWVAHWWQRDPSEIPRPREVPKYIAEYELRMLSGGVEPFRAPQLRRKYTNDSGLYDECARNIPWRQAVVRRRNYQTGELVVTDVPSNRQECVYGSVITGIPRLDSVLHRVRQDFDVQDIDAHVVCNWYPDGKASIGAHSHPFWSAILSFGAPRVFLLDGVPILLSDGDLLVFGTQKHSVPKMPDVEDGRLSVAIFWYPERRSIRSTIGQENSGACAGCGMGDVLLQAAPTGGEYCEFCWSQAIHRMTSQDQNACAEDDMLAAALQLSMVEQ